MEQEYIDSRNTRTWVLNIGGSAAVVAGACAAFCVIPSNQASLRASYRLAGLSFTGLQFLLGAALAYVVVLSVYYICEPTPAESTSWRFFRVVLAALRNPSRVLRHGVSRDDRLAILTTLLKGFFGPFMAIALMQHVTGAVAKGGALLLLRDGAMSPLEMFNRYGYWLALNVVLFVDVLIFTVGYLVETRRLKNEIRSVDPTLLGWAVTLLCYPPFNAVTGAILGSVKSDLASFEDPAVHVVLNVAVLLLMVIYASASVSLGFKASNLTHRGVVDGGPYAYVRHPAYAAKNLAWWISSIPLVGAAFSESLMTGISAVASVVGWTALYVLRALTEEDHLRSVDGEYGAYAARVRHRFIPGIY